VIVRVFCGCASPNNALARKIGSTVRLVAELTIERVRAAKAKHEITPTVVAAIILWNTVYLERAIHLLQQKGRNISDELLVHLSPLGWEHINLTGDYRT